MHPANVYFQPANSYSQRPAEKANIINLVVAYAPPGAAYAIVVNGWHSSREDPRIHCTVDYLDAHNRPMYREHIV
ncbi:uncharacterized protein B0J16DRAFT_386640 [Fusarium flagelliforme]|uniref:uncharacterized protein n=1 Tax=Fusarium flagelliforme TaxID=2675880 RepID=UPI001E8D42E4|nr:uncharacterized protein B0J16DRAFT_386640 [Fusarium flagelliforme]KAH7183567.1 hypothetical protein B0J16DRAFT_386640 [Fusarium flagelliforme]